MIVAVTGGRLWRPAPSSRNGAAAVLTENGVTLVRHGGCTGLDTWFDSVAIELGIPVEVWLPHELWRKRWRADLRPTVRTFIMPHAWRSPSWPSAGPRRNSAMLLGTGLGTPQHGTACMLLKYRGHAGTASCEKLARSYTIDVRDMERWR